MTYALDQAVIATPIGSVRITGDERQVHGIRIEPTGMAGRPGETAAVVAALQQIEAWFAGTLRRFDLPLRAPSTPRGLALRNGLVAVPYGETIRYGDLARRLNSGSRAIGQLCARNPFPIVVPCHRILSGSGADRYSAGAGPATKQWLLAFERRTRGDPHP
jgi:methylated-DNA-[protein]-cysteine S-methyltransferase